MKKIYSITLVIALFFGTIVSYAGNEQRAGQAGASELLINPWTASSGWANSASSSIHGIEAMFHNVAGTSFTKKTELAFSRTNWFQGTKIYINNFGFSQKLGESAGVLSMAFTSMDFGEIINIDPKDVKTRTERQNAIDSCKKIITPIDYNVIKGIVNKAFDRRL